MRYDPMRTGEVTTARAPLVGRIVSAPSVEVLFGDELV
jgi:hypothetical protein